MPQVRLKQNYKYVIADNHGRDNKQQSCTVCALLKNGDTKSLTFGGFIDSDRCDFLQRVKIVGVSAFTTEDNALTGWIDYPSLHYVIGVLKWECYYIVLFDGIPRSVELESVERELPTNNVVQLQKQPTRG